MNKQHLLTDCLRHRQQGFTLVEMIVVLVIIGLLATIVVPNVLDNLDRGNETRVLADFAAFQTALISYRVDNYTYPTTEQGLEARQSRAIGVKTAIWIRYR